MTKITEIGKIGIDFIKSFESFESHPYPDPGTKKEPYTIGYGTTRYFDTKRKVTLQDKPISETEATRLLKGDIQTIFAPLVDKLCRDDLNQNQFDAVCSFVYNAGATYRDKFGKIHYFNLFELINANTSEAVLTKYWEGLAVTGGGKKLPGLVRRRKEEVKLFFKK